MADQGLEALTAMVVKELAGAGNSGLDF